MKNSNGLVIAGVVIGVLVLILLVIAGTYISIYNGLVTTREEVNNGWAQVENQLQRRADLIPNLVSTVKGYASHEDSILTEVTALRSQWGNAKTIEEQIDNANQMNSALARLLVVAESYPNLKANENFLALQAQLEGTENRIAVERMRYNEMVKAYNINIKRFPRSIVAGIHGFAEEEYFEVEAGKEAVPTVNFEK